MATQNFVLFDTVASELVNGDHDFETDSFKIGLVTVAPNESMANPIWPTSFTIAAYGGSYTAEIDIDLRVTGSGNTAIITTADTINLNATEGGPTAATHGVLYNETGQRHAIGFFALDDSAVDLTGNNLTVTLGDLFNLTV